MRQLLLIGGLLFFIQAVQAASPFVFVMIDSATEAKYGSVPLDRKLIARAIDKITAAGAKGIVLKFFFDLPGNEESDRALERSICAGNIALQACFNQREGTTNEVPARFHVNGPPPKAPLAGDAGFIPLPRFLPCAKAVGFVDFADAGKAPLIESYRGKSVKSLYLVALEMAIGQTARLSDAKITFGERSLSMDETGSHPVNLPPAESFTHLPFHEVIDETNSAWQKTVSKSVVVIGYDGEKIHKIETSRGALAAHRYFSLCLRSLGDELKLQ